MIKLKKLLAEAEEQRSNDPVAVLSHEIHNYLTKKHPNFQKLEMPFFNGGGEKLNQYAKTANDAALNKLILQWWELYKQKYNEPNSPSWALTASSDSNDGSMNIYANYYNYDTNQSSVGPVNINKTLDKDLLDSILNDINVEIEINNQDNDWEGTGEGLERVDSLIRFDCEIKIGNDEIDLDIEFDENGDVENINIKDPDLAKRHGITSDSVMKYLLNQGI